MIHSGNPHRQDGGKGTGELNFAFHFALHLCIVCIFRLNLLYLHNVFLKNITIIGVLLCELYVSLTHVLLP